MQPMPSTCRALQVSAASVSLDAQHGGILQESAQSTQAHNNWGVTLGAGGSVGKTTLADAGEHETPKTQRGINARAKVDVDHLKGTTQHNSLITAGDVTLNSAGDTHLAGARIDADKVSGTVGGDLVVESRKDQVNSTQVNVDARLDVEKNQPGVVDKLAKTTGPLKDKVKPRLKARSTSIATSWRTSSTRAPGTWLRPRTAWSTAWSMPRNDWAKTHPQWQLRREPRAPWRLRHSRGQGKGLPGRQDRCPGHTPVWLQG